MNESFFDRAAFDAMNKKHEEEKAKKMEAAHEAAIGDNKKFDETNPKEDKNFAENYPESQAPWKSLEISALNQMPKGERAVWQLLIDRGIDPEDAGFVFSSIAYGDAGWGSENRYELEVVTPAELGLTGEHIELDDIIEAAEAKGLEECPGRAIIPALEAGMDLLKDAEDDDYSPGDENVVIANFCFHQDVGGAHMPQISMKRYISYAPGSSTSKFTAECLQNPSSDDFYPYSRIIFVRKNKV